MSQPTKPQLDPHPASGGVNPRVTFGRTVRVSTASKEDLHQGGFAEDPEAAATRVLLRTGRRVVRDGVVLTNADI